MTEAEFLKCYKATLDHIEQVVEDAINDHDTDIDYESGDDILTLSFNDGSVLIISRQSAISQLWLAARSGGFHYDYDDASGDWICTLNGKRLSVMLEELCREQGGVEISFARP